ncbi:uncharacterized protein SCHCODRAFT_02682484 [Schizophyllum commune H4-8]|nr:uncharacterized protein SCHCODRAFT_02682484 [Schizophyllum commune H4-8]KAI5899479.1 hypothetical protein SCHCODRAFT_02682484 [Schizophyllum commune H4-8]
MTKKDAHKTRTSQPATKKQRSHTSEERVAKDQLMRSHKRGSCSLRQSQTAKPGSSLRRKNTKHKAAALTSKPGSDLGPNLPALATALEHMYATMNGTLAPGQEPAKYSSVYQYLPKHLRIEEGTVIPQRPPLTSFGGDTINCLYSEEAANELLILECGSVEKGKELVKEAYQTAEFIGGQPDPEDPTIDRIDLPNLPFHLRLWLGHQKTFVSFDFCDNQTRRPVLKHRNLTVFMQSPGSLNALQLQPLEKCFHYDQSVGYNSFVVPESAVLEIRWMGKNIKTVQMPAREQPAQPARAARGVREVAKSPIQFLAEVTGNPHIAAMIKA